MTVFKGQKWARGVFRDCSLFWPIYAIKGRSHIILLMTVANKYIDNAYDQIYRVLDGYDPYIVQASDETCLVAFGNLPQGLQHKLCISTDNERTSTYGYKWHLRLGDIHQEPEHPTSKYFTTIEKFIQVFITYYEKINNGPITMRKETTPDTLTQKNTSGNVWE